MNLYYLFVVLLTAILTASADYTIKIAAHRNSFINFPFLIGVTFYIFTAFSWYYAVKNNNLYTTGIIYDMTVILLLSLIGIFVLNEKVNIYSILGMLCAFMSIILISKA